MSFFGNLVDSMVSFANDSARTVAEEVINPAVSIIQNQLQRPRDVLEQQQILDNLQESNGSHFPGDDYHSPDRKNWMAHLSVDKLTLNKIVWPGTHDSATNGIGDPVFTRWKTAVSAMELCRRTTLMSSSMTSLDFCRRPNLRS
ncbi:unnamed protein product [Arabidopsis lyrata]|nr:unnamed protein product [Arabidopsis lyrata]